MSDDVNSKVQASVWLKPDQLDALRTAVYRCRPDYLQERDDTILTLMSDTGVRVGELVAIDTDHLRDDNSVLSLPAHIQKDYPTDTLRAPLARTRERDHTNTYLVSIPSLERHHRIIPVPIVGASHHRGSPKHVLASRRGGGRRAVPPRRLTRDPQRRDTSGAQTLGRVSDDEHRGREHAA